jgi:hypothetical protein
LSPPGKSMSRMDPNGRSAFPVLTADRPTPPITQLGTEDVEHGRRKATGDQVAPERLPVLVGLAYPEHHRRLGPAGGAEVIAHERVA